MFAEYADDQTTTGYGSVKSVKTGKAETEKTTKYWVGTNKPKVQIVIDEPLHWSQMPRRSKGFPPRDYGDNDASDPENNWEQEN